jgi:hypothetical protein
VAEVEAVVVGDIFGVADGFFVPKIIEMTPLLVAVLSSVTL